MMRGKKTCEGGLWNAVKQYTGIYIKHGFSFPHDGHNLGTVLLSHLKFCTALPYRSCIKHSFEVNNYKHGDSAKI